MASLEAKRVKKNAKPSVYLNEIDLFYDNYKQALVFEQRVLSANNKPAGIA